MAGVGAMTRRRFYFYNVIGGTLWVNSFFWGGYFFGNLPAVKEHFSMVVIAIVLISVLPAVILALKNRAGKKSAAKTPGA